MDPSSKAEAEKFNPAPHRVAEPAQNQLAIFGLCLLFTLFMIHHWVFPLNALPYISGINGYDCGQMVWNLWHVNESITSGRNPYVTNQVYYPTGANLAHHTLAAGYFPVTFMVKKLSGGDAMYPIYTYRIIPLLCFTLLLFFSFLFLLEVRMTRWAAAMGAIAYSFSHFYMAHVIHINHLAGFFIPLTALLAVRSYRSPTTGKLILLAVTSSVAVYFTEFALYIYVGALLFALLILLHSKERRELAERMRRAGAKLLLAPLTISALILLPFLFEFFSVRTIKPTAGEPSLYSANLAGFFIPLPDRARLYGSLFASLSSRITAGMGEPGIFIGFPLLIFGVIALVKTKERLIRLSALASLVFFGVSLGPTLKIFAIDTRFPLPYALLMRVPPFDSGRTPVRLVVMALFFLMIVAASGASFVEGKLKGRWGHWNAPVMALLLLWVIGETYSPAPPPQVVSSPRGLEKLVSGPVLNLPLMINDGYSELLQVFHHQPIATGFLARYTQQQLQHLADLEELFNKGGPQFCAGVASMGYRNIVIAQRGIFPNVPSLAPLDLSQCSLNIVDLRRGDLYSRTTGNEETPDEFPPYTPGARVDFLSPESDKFLWYGWSAREPAFRWTNRNKAAVVFGLSERKPLTLRMSLGAFLVPGKIDQQQVNVELNGRPIATLVLKESAPREYSIAVPADVLQERNVLIFGLPNADSPASLGLSKDNRSLAINVHWLEIDSSAASKNSRP